MHDNSNLSLSLGGSSVTTNIQNVGWRIIPKHIETKSLTAYGKSKQLSKLSGEIEVGLFSTISGTQRVDHINVTTLSFGGKDALCNMYSFKVAGSFSQIMDPSACGKFEKPANKGKDYTITLEVAIPDDTWQALQLLFADPVEANRKIVVTAIINGVTVTIPCTAGELVHSFPDEDNQKVTFTAHGDAPATGAYPTAPIGTSSLLEWVLNDSKTAKAFSLDTHPTEGITYAGFVIPSSFEFFYDDGTVVTNNYSLVTVGEFTGTGN